MSMPPIEIRWGGGKWPNAPKQRLRPLVRNALDIAQLCLAEGLGVHSDVPKVASIWCIDNNDDTAGSTDSASEFELYVPHRFIRRPKKTERLTLPFLMHAAHELVHTPGELTQPFAQPFTDELSRGLLEDHLYLEAFELVHETEAPDADAIHALWFDAAPVPGALPYGYGVGMLSVGALLEAGAEFRDVLRMPAQDIIGVH